MAKITPYKFVNPGLSAKSSPAVKAANQTTLAVNRLGVTVDSIARLISDLGTTSALKLKLDKAQEQALRREERLRKDAAAEAAEEKVDKKQVKDDKNKILKVGKKIGKGAFGWLEAFLGPIGSALLNLGAFALTSEFLEYLSDEENRDKITTFLERTEFVFNKLKEIAENIGSAIGEGLDFIFGKETTIEERLNAFGKIAMAIGGIAGMIAAAGGLRDLLDTGEDLLPDSSPDGRRPQGDSPDRPKRPKKPTPTNPSGANPEFEGPRGRPPVSDIANTYGEAAAKQYKKILAEYGDDAARAYSNALLNSGGDASKALKAWKRLKLTPLPKPRPNALQRLGGFVQGVAQGAVQQGRRFGNWAYDKSGKLIKSLQGLPGWAAEQYGKMSTAARKKWDDVSKVGSLIAEKGNKWASAAGNKLKAAGNWVVDGGKKAFSNLASGAKNFFLEKVMTPLKPLIDPIAKKAAQIGQALFDMLMKIPGAKKILEVLKKKGINSMADVATAGSKLGKRAAAVLPVIGGIVNLAFAYDRAANGDSIGALIEGTSGILDIAGLATAGAGSVASMLLDGYMFARDFIPQLQQGEEAVVDAVGARGLKNSIDNILSKLPNIGEIINMFMGKSNQTTDEPDTAESEMAVGGVVRPQEMFLGGVVKSIGKAVGNVVSNPIVQTAASFIPGAAPVMAGIGAATGLMSGNPLGAITQGLGMIPGMGSIASIAGDIMGGNYMNAFSSAIGFNPLSMVNNVANQYGLGGIMKAVMGQMSFAEGAQEAATSMGIDPKLVRVAGSAADALSTGGMSERYVLQQAIEFLPVPIVLTKLQTVPQAVPINNSASNVIPGGSSSLTKRMQ